MKKVILIANYFHFASEKASNRFRQIAELLSAQQDIQLELITSIFYQRTKERRSNLEKLTDGLQYKVTFIEEPGYSKNISFKRLNTSRIFGRNVLKYIKSIEKPDLIYQSVPTLDVAEYIGKYAEDNNIPFVIDIQDLWPEAYRIALNIPIISDIVFAPLKRKANRIYSRADAICAVSQTYTERALSVNKKGAQGHPVFIGIDLKQFDMNASMARKNNEKKLKLAYCGSLDKSYDLMVVIDALSCIEDPPLFVVMGDGSRKMEFEAYAKSKNVEAVFTGYLAYADMCKQLCECDITVNPIIGTSVATIINKHGDYAACGLPVLNTQDNDEYKRLVDRYEMGFNCKNGDYKDLAAKLKMLCENEALRISMGENARRCAEEKFDRNRTYVEILQVVRAFLDA